MMIKEGAIQVLRQIEWSGGHDRGGYCMWCGKFESQGHAEDCKLGGLLSEEQGGWRIIHPHDLPRGLMQTSGGVRDQVGVWVRVTDTEFEDMRGREKPDSVAAREEGRLYLRRKYGPGGDPLVPGVEYEQWFVWKGQ